MKTVTSPQIITVKSSLYLQLQKYNTAVKALAIISCVTRVLVFPQVQIIILQKVGTNFIVSSRRQKKWITKISLCPPL